MKIISKQQTSPRQILFTVEVSGPNHMSLFIQPLSDAKLVDWSFTKIPLQEKFDPPYYVYFSYALDPTPLRFNLEFEVRSLEPFSKENPQSYVNRCFEISA